MTVNGINWLFQTVDMPLIAYLASLLLPASYIAKLLKRQIEKKVNGGGDGS